MKKFRDDQNQLFIEPKTQQIREYAERYARLAADFISQPDIIEPPTLTGNLKRDFQSAFQEFCDAWDLFYVVQETRRDGKFLSIDLEDAVYYLDRAAHQCNYPSDRDFSRSTKFFGSSISDHEKLRELHWYATNGNTPMAFGRSGAEITGWHGFSAMSLLCLSDYLIHIENQEEISSVHTLRNGVVLYRLGDWYQTRFVFNEDEYQRIYVAYIGDSRYKALRTRHGRNRRLMTFACQIIHRYITSGGMTQKAAILTARNDILTKRNELKAELTNSRYEQTVKEWYLAWRHKNGIPVLRGRPKRKGTAT